MLQNVAEVDGEMRAASLLDDSSGAVFFDFAAVFPSLARDYMLDVLKSLQIPLHIRNFIGNL